METNTQTKKTKQNRNRLGQKTKDVGHQSLTQIKRIQANIVAVAEPDEAIKTRVITGKETGGEGLVKMDRMKPLVIVRADSNEPDESENGSSNDNDGDCKKVNETVDKWEKTNTNRV